MNILGLSCYYHDAAAALVRDGQLLAAAEEERFNRVKHYNEFPACAVDYCLREGGIDMADVDAVVFYEKPFTKFNRILETILGYWPLTYAAWLKAMPLWLGHRLKMGADLADHLQRLTGGAAPHNADAADGATLRAACGPAVLRTAASPRARILYNQHHLSHAASAFLVSPFEEAAIISADGVGEWTTTAWGAGRGTRIELHREIRFPHSVGLLFSAITAYLGFRVNDAEWKVMGLAPYGKPTLVDKFRRIVDVRDDGSFRLDMKYFAHGYSTKLMFNRRWERLFGQPQRKREAELTDFHRDIAHSGQKIVEEIMVKMGAHVRRETGLKRVCIAGGVGLNCVANWRILQESGFDNIFIQPAAGDSGGAIGAAFYLHNTVLGRPREFVMEHALWGPGFTDEEVRATLQREGADYECVAGEDELLERTAQLIADGKVIGWFQGRMEFGPRALGARSILADPRRADIKDLINSKVKFREAFRPFAPAVLKEFAHEYFDMPEGMDAPFMLLVPKVRANMRAKIPAVTHEDGTGRVQTLTERVNGRFYRLVRAFHRRTGVPVVVNTSFNVRGEPIVCTPEDAYHTFLNTGIDALVIGSFVVTHKPGQVDFHAGLRRSIALEQPELVR
ncbi:MAG: carbamoyltransferase [Phycisphaerales bacterium]|nr:carbamoyltransferase [Phycisphaerales bacterium]